MDLSVTRKPDLKTESIAGITTFFTMAYIVVVNPQILSADGKTGMAFTGVLTATMLVCFTMTLLMGMYAKLPFAVAPGIGIFLTLKLSLLPSIIAVLFTDLFDSISTFIGVAHAADLLDEHGHPRNLREDIQPVMYVLAVILIGLLLLE